MTGRAERLTALLFCGGLLIYVLGFMAWYSLTPLGLMPAADDREILELARQIAGGTLPHEAFYRAPGYPALLALGLCLGVPDTALLLFARGLNLASHLASTALVFTLARRLWASPWAAWLAAMLVGFNPVLLHFAGDALDITVAMTLMLAGFTAMLPARPARPASALAGLAFALAGLCRPQLLPLLVLPLGQAVLAPGGAPRLFPVLLAAILPLLAMGGSNQRLAGDFRIMPWQGAFNLWAANHPGANGRYFVQTLRIESYEPGANTARLESEALYRADPANAGASDDYRAMTRYWRQRALAAVASEPLAWLGLMGQKLRHLLGNEEQYNNKTYAFHKARSPWLAPNPLCWAVVFGLGAAGAVVGWRRPALRWMALGVLVCAASTLLFYVSDRFRAPLIPLLAVCAGGVLELRRSRTSSAALVTAAAALLLASWPPGYPTNETVIQDRIQLATSATTLGLHQVALAEIDAVDAADAGRPSVIALRCVVLFNAWLAGASNDEQRWAHDCTLAAMSTREARLQAAHADWRAGRDAQAIETWRALAGRAGPSQDTALAALLYANALTVEEEHLLGTETAKASPVVLAVMATRHDDAWRELVALVGTQDARRNVAAVERLWSRSREKAAPGGR